MILIHHLSSDQVALVGSRDAYQQIGAMVNDWLCRDADTIRVLAVASTADDEEQKPAFLRFRSEEFPLKLKRLGRDLLIKGDDKAMFAFCEVLDFPPECEAGAAMQLRIETSDTEIASLTVHLIEG